jgi:DNA-directed RNA polymerase specialized sigma24 family protein
VAAGERWAARRSPGCHLVRRGRGRRIVASWFDRLAQALGREAQGGSALGLTQGLSFEDDVAVLRAWLEPRSSAPTRSCCIAVLVLDENQREAAERLGLSHDAARKRFQRALGRLREHLASSLSHSDLAGRVCPPRTG